MSQDTALRNHGLQPPLPLVEPEVPDDASPGPTVADWQLDERTREVGRRGIAAARARLRHATGAARDGTPATDDLRHAPGRAA